MEMGVFVCCLRFPSGEGSAKKQTHCEHTVSTSSLILNVRITNDVLLVLLQRWRVNLDARIDAALAILMAIAYTLTQTHWKKVFTRSLTCFSLSLGKFALRSTPRRTTCMSLNGSVFAIEKQPALRHEPTDRKYAVNITFNVLLWPHKLSCFSFKKTLTLTSTVEPAKPSTDQNRSSLATVFCSREPNAKFSLLTFPYITTARSERMCM